MDRSVVIAVRALGLGALLLCPVAFTPAVNRVAALASVEERLGPAQAIVVLGSGVNPDGSLSASSLRRVTHGVVLYTQGLSPVLVFSGATQHGGPSEAVIAARLAAALGVPGDAILAEGRGRTTREEASRIAALLSPRGVRRVLLVSDALHLRRAQPLFERVGFEVLPAPAHRPAKAATAPEERLALLQQLFQEALAQVYYRVAGYL